MDGFPSPKFPPQAPSEQRKATPCSGQDPGSGHGFHIKQIGKNMDDVNSIIKWVL